MLLQGATSFLLQNATIFFTKCDDYYKVRQNGPEVSLSCEYLINLLRRRFKNYYTILRVINKTQFKTRVVLNYQRKLLRLHLFFLSHLGSTTPWLNSVQPVEAFLVGILVSYFTHLHCHELSLQPPKIQIPTLTIVTVGPLLSQQL